MIEWALLVVILWYIADSAVYLFRYYSRQGREAGRDSGQSPFKLIPAKIAGYNWVRCGGCGGEVALMPGEPKPRRCLVCDVV